MAYVSLARSTPGLLLLTALGCSTADGLDPGSGGTSGQAPDDPLQPTPEPEGEACGSDVLGWQTDCHFVGEISYENPLALGEYLELDPFEDMAFACCEGAPSTNTANSACMDLCRAELCRIAGNIYRQIANENGWHCTQGCDFDTDACLAGIPVQQFPHPPSGDDFPHEVMVSCEATNVEPRRPDGAFEFLDIPENKEWNDPDVCDPMAPPAGGRVRAKVSRAARTLQWRSTTSCARAEMSNVWS
jgi:hypothetical protein